MLTKIAVFNHKGGVSKTTTCFNLGWCLARKGKKVILVDADSQCNLTLYVIGYKEYEKIFMDDDYKNINEALAPAYKSQPKLIEPFPLVAVEKNPNLSLIPGHLDFSENEVQLGISLELSNAFGAMKNLPGAFDYLITKTAQAANADFVIFDMNPSLSALNQDILMSSTHFLVPTSPDFFSVSAITSLSRMIPTWEKWGKRARPLLEDAIYPMPKTTPKFLGYTINDFNLSNGKPQPNFKVIMKRISEEVENVLVPALEKEGMLLDKEVYQNAYEEMVNSAKRGNVDYNDYYCLAEISNFNKLIALSNEKSIPIFELMESDVSLGEGQFRTLQWFKFLYNAVADRIIKLVNSHDPSEG